jgi:hypothetical protein
MLDVVILRGMHPNEVTAFYLAKEASTLLRQRGYGMKLVTMPYEFSLSYIADHAPTIVPKHFEFMGCLDEEAEELERDFFEEVKKFDPSNRLKDYWDSALCDMRTFNDYVRQSVRKESGTAPIIDFHNSPASALVKSRGSASAFRVAPKYIGDVYANNNVDGCYIMEIPALFRTVPKIVQERRKDVIKEVRHSMHPQDSWYLTKVADFPRSKQEGLTCSSAAGGIVNAIENVIINSV